MNKQTTPSTRKAYDPDKLQALLQYIGRLLPNDEERAAFYQCSRTPPPASLRLNALQAQAQHVRPYLCTSTWPKRVLVQRWLRLAGKRHKSRPDH